MSLDVSTCLTPPQLAKRWACKPSTVIAKIRRGELRAFDLSEPDCVRPRYRISLEAITEFELKKSIVSVPRVTRSPRRDQAVKSFV